ncbi:MAG: Spy/CpxP family protein refolding chaperone [Rubrivivax sp.]|nr:Spy/CpxP family protein refolding chaperone [Rubrivivax sp.]
MMLHSRSNTTRHLLALATLALAGTTALAAGPGGPAMHMRANAMDPMAAMGGPGMGRMLEQIGASAEQRGQIEQIVAAARGDLRTQHEQGRALHEQMRQLFVQPTVDAAAVEALRQQMLAQHDQASQRMTQTMLEASAVLSAEQRQQLATLMRQRVEKKRGRRGEPADGERPGA